MPLKHLRRETWLQERGNFSLMDCLCAQVLMVVPSSPRLIMVIQSMTSCSQISVPHNWIENSVPRTPIKATGVLTL